ncbi:hypothetical protein P7C70_g7672, partial [Phenoliferia sp. Uapishka_3]
MNSPRIAELVVELWIQKGNGFSTPPLQLELLRSLFPSLRRLESLDVQSCIFDEDANRLIDVLVDACPPLRVLNFGNHDNASEYADISHVIRLLRSQPSVRTLSYTAPILPETPIDYFPRFQLEELRLRFGDSQITDETILFFTSNSMDTLGRLVLESYKGILEPADFSALSFDNLKALHSLTFFSENALDAFNIFTDFTPLPLRHLTIDITVINPSRISGLLSGAATHPRIFHHARYS